MPVLQNWKTKTELSVINFNGKTWCGKSIHFSLWWKGYQWRNKYDRGWNRWRDYNVDLHFFQLFVLFERKKLSQQYFEFVNKRPALSKPGEIVLNRSNDSVFLLRKCIDIDKPLISFAPWEFEWRLKYLVTKPLPQNVRCNFSKNLLECKT